MTPEEARNLVQIIQGLIIMVMCFGPIFKESSNEDQKKI